MYGKVLKIIYRIENNSVISSIRKGFTLLIPALLVGAFALLFSRRCAVSDPEFSRVSAIITRPP